MKIRSITYFINPEYPLNIEKLRSAGEFMKVAKNAYIEKGYEVQTVRLATVPFPILWHGLDVDAMVLAAISPISNQNVLFVMVLCLPFSRSARCFAYDRTPSGRLM